MFPTLSLLFRELKLPFYFHINFCSVKLLEDTEYLKNSDEVFNNLQQDEVADPLPVESYVTIEWDIPRDTAAGKYRIVYHGDHMSTDGKVTSFTGTSSSFTVYR